MSSIPIVKMMCWFEMWRRALTLVLVAVLVQLLRYAFPPPTVSRLVPSEGIIVISSSSGGGRELALTLADAGFQVIVGVSTNQEKKSYRYSTSKGLVSLMGVP